jgi:hypothetical protein
MSGIIQDKFLREILISSAFFRPAHEGGEFTTQLFGNILQRIDLGWNSTRLINIFLDK